MTRFSQYSNAVFQESVWTMQKINEIKQHPAWQGRMTEFESEQALQCQVPFTFLLRPGKDAHHYVLSFVDFDHSIVHKPVSIEVTAKGWFYRNGGGHIREKLMDLIPVALHCSPHQCKPYVKSSACF